MCKIVISFLLISLFTIESKAGGMLDTTSLEWNQEVDKCVNLLNGAIERNQNIEDSISADNHFNFNRLNTTFDAQGNTKMSENVVSYQYVIDRNDFNFISQQSKSNLNGKLKALKDNAGISYYILFQPSDYKMTPIEAASFNSKVFGRSNLGNSTTNKGILIIVSVNQTSSSKLYWKNPYYIPTPIIFTTTSTSCILSLSTGAGVNPEVKNEFSNIITSVFRNTYDETQREQKYLGVFDAVYRKINFSRKVYAYQVDKRGNINEELFTLPATMGNNEAAIFSLHVQYPYYEAGHANDPKYYKQPNPIREEYIKQYAKAYVLFCAYSNFSGLYSTTFIIEPPGIIYKDAYQNHIDWSLVIDIVGLQASCLGLDIVTDFVGAVYSASQGKWLDASIYTGAMFLPFVSGTVIKVFLAAGKTFSKGASFLIRKTTSITNEVSNNIWKFYTTSAKTKVFVEININGDLIIKEFSTVNFTGGTDDIVRSASYTNPTGQIETGDIAFTTNANGLSGVTKNLVSGTTNLAWIDDLVSLLPSGSKTKITSWIANGLDATKLKTAFNTTADKTILYNKLNSSKGINHQRAIIGDYNSISGVTQGSFVSNAVADVNSNILKNADNKQFTMFPAQSKTFVQNASLSVRNSIEVIEDLGNGIQFIKIKPGTKIYRVFDGYKPWDDISMIGNTLPNGSFWTFEKPTIVSDVIEGTAVMPEWNGMTKIIEIEVPSAGLFGWYGKAAKQPASSTTSSFYLQGGEEQIIINFGQNQQSISSITTSITAAPWIK